MSGNLQCTDKTAAVASVEGSESSVPPIDLPIELWLAIIRHTTDIDTLTQMTRVSRAFHREIKPLLYRAVHLGSDYTVGLFLRTLSLSPDYARLVNTLTVMIRDIKFRPFARRSTRHYDSPPKPPEGNFNAILEIHFPTLRRFVTDISGRPMDEFLEKHCYTLEDLRILDVHIPLGAHSEPRFRCLRSLSCPQPALIRMGASSLTHLHLPSLDTIPSLLAIPIPFGARLVSLRIGVSNLLIRGGDTRSGSLDAVAARFTRLRYLQIDMSYAVLPTLSELQKIQFLWNRGLKSDSAAPSGSRRAHGSRITIAWVFLGALGGVSSRNSGVDVGVWLKYLNKAALDVLMEWRDLVERIVYRHEVVQPVSVALDESGTALVRRLDEEMSEDYWESVSASKGY